jgi:hypothetical protein
LRRHAEAERFGGLEVDDQFELCWPFRPSHCVRFFNFDIWIGGVHQQRNPRNFRGDFPHKLDPLFDAIAPD